jgi:hypothetical protein
LAPDFQGQLLEEKIGANSGPARIRRFPQTAVKIALSTQYLATTQNESLVKVQSLAAKQVSGVYKVAQRDVRSTFRVHRANYNDLQASVQSKENKFNLSKFGVVARKQTLPVIQEMRVKTTPVKHSFVVITKSGHFGIFQRRGKARFANY